MLIVLVWAGLSGCTPGNYPAQKPPHESEREMNDKITKDMEAMDREQAQEDSPQPADFESIVGALGCIFDPNDCPIKKSKEEQKMDR